MDRLPDEIIGKVAAKLAMPNMKRIAVIHLDFSLDDLTNFDTTYGNDPWSYNAYLLREWRNKKPENNREVRYFPFTK